METTQQNPGQAGFSPANYIARYLVLRFRLQTPINHYARNIPASTQEALWHER